MAKKRNNAGTDAVEKYNSKGRDGGQLNKFGMLRRHLIKEHGSKISNELKIITGEAVGKTKGIKNIIRQLKYSCAEHGKVALVKSDKTHFVGKVLASEDYGTNTLYYLKVAFKQISSGSKTYLLTKEYMLDPRAKEQNSFVVKTSAWSDSTNQEVSLSEINGIIGRELFNVYEVLDTAYIPAAIFEWDYEGKSPIFEMDELFLLERQLLREIPRDLNLSRKKILYKTRLARKTSKDLEIEMTEKSIVVFEDGNAIFSSPIDLWAPALAVKAITDCIEWLFAYALKVSFAAKDTMSTGAQKTNDQVSEVNQGPQNVLEDILQSWSEVMSEFLSKTLNEETEVEFQAMTTVDRLINNPGGGTTPPPATPKEGE